MPIFNYDILGLTPGKPKSFELYGGVVQAETPKAALLAALDAEFGDKDDGDTPYERLIAGWADEYEIAACVGSMRDDENSLVLPVGDLEFHVSVEFAEPITETIRRGLAEAADAKMVQDAEAHAPDDIDDIRPSDRFVQ